VLANECGKDLENLEALAYLEIQQQKYKYSLHYDLKEELVLTDRKA